MKPRKPTPTQAEALAVLNEHLKDGYGEPLTYPFDEGKALTVADLINLKDARATTGKKLEGWSRSAIFLSVNSLVERYEAMPEAERVAECHGEHISGWFEEQGYDEADHEGEFLSTPSHYWPDRKEGKPPSVNDYRDALEHCARNGILAFTS